MYKYEYHNTSMHTPIWASHDALHIFRVSIRQLLKQVKQDKTIDNAYHVSVNKFPKLHRDCGMHFQVMCAWLLKDNSQ
mgnify:CR=1 FL=1